MKSGQPALEKIDISPLGRRKAYCYFLENSAYVVLFYLATAVVVAYFAVVA
jgi:hypothetical protein